MAQNVQYVKVTTTADVDRMCALAKEIWHEHFTPIIGHDQVVYMLEKFQSPAAVNGQIKEGYEYYLTMVDDQLVGYIGIHREPSALFLSKLYLEKSARGKGYARCGMNFLEKICRENHLEKIWLTVNKYNKNTIAAYQKMGLSIVREQKADIGNGFFMDDYIMEKKID